MVSPVIAAVIAVVAGVVAAAIAFFAGVSYRRKTAEAKIGSAEEEAKRLINDAMKAAQQKRKEALIEAKDEAFQLKAEADKEIKERRSELSRQERRLDQKEEAMDRKTAVLEQKETDLAKRSELVEARLDEIEQIKARELDKMETIAGLTAEDAKQLLLNRLDEQLTHEKAMHIAAFETQTKDECDTMARELISQAVARCAADHSSEATVSVVPLPSDEMKGRIIGREGRNIRALETATGVDLIIDDTPEAITLSSFDPVRREVARMTLEKLISDGRIHPARIEETVEKCRRELELAMKREGEKAVMDVGVHGIHPDMVKLLGRLRYRTSYGQNVLNHSLEVAYLSGILAAELGVNVTQAKRAGLLHDRRVQQARGGRLPGRAGRHGIPSGAGSRRAGRRLPPHRPQRGRQPFLLQRRGGGSLGSQTAPHRRDHACKVGAPHGYRPVPAGSRFRRSCRAGKGAAGA